MIINGYEPIVTSKKIKIDYINNPHARVVNYVLI